MISRLVYLCIDSFIYIDSFTYIFNLREFFLLIRYGYEYDNI